MLVPVPTWYGQRRLETNRNIRSFGRSRLYLCIFQPRIGEDLEDSSSSWFYLLTTSKIHCPHMQSWKYCNYKENAIRKTNQAFLQRSLVESCRSAGSVCWPSKVPDTVKKRVRRVGPATVQLDSVMTSFVFWRNNTVLYCISCDIAWYDNWHAVKWYSNRRPSELFVSYFQSEVEC